MIVLAASVAFLAAVLFYPALGLDRASRLMGRIDMLSLQQRHYHRTVACFAAVSTVGWPAVGNESHRVWMRFSNPSLGRIKRQPRATMLT